MVTCIINKNGNNVIQDIARGPPPGVYLNEKGAVAVLVLVAVILEQTTARQGRVYVIASTIYE